MSIEMTEKAAELARRWMIGYRKNTMREAWKHPLDLIELLHEMPGPWAEVDQMPFMETVAWLHDLLEDGIKEDGERVDVDCLRAAGFVDEVISSVELLTRRDNEEKSDYFHKIQGAPEVVLVIKALDRIANLREGLVTYTSIEWLTRYVRQTEMWVLPFVRRLPLPHGPWLERNLNEIMDRCVSAGM
jgi:(p)ppGpp synthase/HD superfamily hydrolase